MENEGMKRCPYCSELIKSEAIKCRYCGSMLTEKRTSTGYWYRVNRGKKIAGVCTGIAQEFNSEKLIIPLRLFFVLSTILYGFGLIIYIVLWLIMPEPIDTPVKAGIASPADDAAAGGGSYEHADVTSQRTSRPKNAAIGIFLIIMGAILVLGLFARGYWIGIPFVGHYDFPHIFPGYMGIWNTWIPGIWTFLIIAGLLLLLLEGFRFIRFLLGCGFVIIGSILLVFFIPFMPKVFLLPVMLIIGCVLVILGVIKLIFGT